MLISESRAWCVLSLFFFGHCGCRGSFSHNEQNDLIVFRAIPMNLLAIMGDEAASRHSHGALIGVELASRADIPSPLKHGDKAVVGMKMRPAEMVSFRPFRHHGIKARFGWIANQNGILCAACIRRAPGNLVG